MATFLSVCLWMCAVTIKLFTDHIDYAKLVFMYLHCLTDAECGDQFREYVFDGFLLRHIRLFFFYVR